MTFDVMGSHPDVENNVIRLETPGIVLEPAPITPDNGAAWDLFGGTVKAVFPGAIVVPSAMTAFTDTQCESCRCNSSNSQSTGTFHLTSTDSRRRP